MHLVGFTIERYFFSSLYPDQFWGTASHLSYGHRRYFPWSKVAELRCHSPALSAEVLVPPLCHEFTRRRAQLRNDAILLRSLIILHTLTVQGVREVPEVLEPLFLTQCPVLSIHNKYGSLLLELKQQKGI